jgi:hypothetical protein
VDDDLVDGPGVQALARDVRPEDLNVLSSGGITGRSQRLLEAGDECGLWIIERVLRMMGENEHGSRPAAAVDPIDTVVLGTRDVVPAAPAQDRAGFAHHLLTKPVRPRVLERVERPVHRMLRSSDEPVGRHRDVPDELSHVNLPCALAVPQFRPRLAAELIGLLDDASLRSALSLSSPKTRSTGSLVVEAAETGSSRGFRLRW